MRYFVSNTILIAMVTIYFVNFLDEEEEGKAFEPACAAKQAQGNGARTLTLKRLAGNGHRAGWCTLLVVVYYWSRPR